MKKYYLHIPLGAKVSFLKNYSSKLSKYMTLFGFTKSDIDKVVADSANLEIFFNFLESNKNYAKALTAYRNHLMNGDSDNKALPTLTAPPAPPVFATTLVGDIFGRVMAQVQVIKNSPNVTDDILKDLGIYGIEEQAIDVETIKPEISVALVGGRPVVKWKKNKMQGIHIYVDRGDGKGYGSIPYTDMKPDFEDNFALPVSGQTAIWKYKAYYIMDDAEIGLESNEVVITVIGK